MIKRGKYFVSPPNDGSDFKVLFKRLVSIGAGRPVDKDGFPLGPWTPEQLAMAISQIDENKEGIDLRTVQHWFQDNEKGISSDNIRWLARILACDDPDAYAAWQLELSVAHSRLVGKRKQKRKQIKRDLTPPSGPTQVGEAIGSVDVSTAAVVNPPKQRFDLAKTSMSLFSGRSTLNLPAAVWAGSVTLGVLAYIMGVHSVTYSPVNGLHKQVGFFWAPNWTLLEMVVLPLFLIIVVALLAFWKEERYSIVMLFGAGLGQDNGWASRVQSFSLSHWAVVFICFFIVFILQWCGVHLRALMTGEYGDLVMDWNLLALVRPEIISVPEAIVLSMLAFLYTAGICYLFLTGLVLLYTLVQDFCEICGNPNLQSSTAHQIRICDVGTKIICGIFRGCVLGIWIATCIKLQASYLLSDGETIVKWLLSDARFALGFHNEVGGWLDQRSLANFTSLLLVFSTCFVFFFGFIQIYRTLELASISQSANRLGNGQRIPWWTMLGVVMLLVTKFLLIGQIPGFSILLFIGLLVTLYSLYDPMFGRAQLGKMTAIEN